jgi:hypothetical protein
MYPLITMAFNDKSDDELLSSGDSSTYGSTNTAENSNSTTQDINLRSMANEQEDESIRAVDNLPHAVVGETSTETEVEEGKD